jgi:hypothetical protein
MALTTRTFTTPLITTQVTDATADLTIETAASAAQNLYFVEIANPNTNTPVYVKLFTAASGSTISTQHELQLYCPAGSTCYTYITETLPWGTGMQFYASVEPGVQSNTNTLTAPAKSVAVRVGIVAQ